MAVETPHQWQLDQVLQCRETLSSCVWDPGFCSWSCRRVIWTGDNFEQRLSGKFIPQYGGQWNSNNGTGRLRLNHQRDSSIGVGQDPTGTWCCTCRRHGITARCRRQNSGNPWGSTTELESWYGPFSSIPWDGGRRDGCASHNGYWFYDVESLHTWCHSWDPYLQW